MANIVIKDLNVSEELDRKAMTAILGGRRSVSHYSSSYSLSRKPHRPFIESAKKGHFK